MYSDPKLQESIAMVEAARERNITLDPRRMTAEEKDTLLKTYHPDYRTEEFAALDFGPSKGEKVPLELKHCFRASPGYWVRTSTCIAPTMTPTC